MHLRRVRSVADVVRRGRGADRDGARKPAADCNGRRGGQDLRRDDRTIGCLDIDLAVTDQVGVIGIRKRLAVDDIDRVRPGTRRTESQA